MLLDAKHDPNTTSIAPPREDDQRTTSSATLAPPILDPSNNQLERSTRHNILTICLHVVLVLVHIVLLVAWFKGLLHSIIVSPGSPSTRLLLVITVFSQIIAVVYTASLVTLMQKIALRQTLHVPQPLSAIHDKFEAWSNVGQSFLTLFRQGEVTTSLSGIGLIAAYLTGISLILITSPALFTLIPTITATPVALNVQYLNLQQKSLGDINALSSVSILSSLAVLSRPVEQPGLSGNVFYGVVNGNSQQLNALFEQEQLDNPTISDSKVNATTFHVNCGLLPGSYQASSEDTNFGKVWDINTPLQNATIPTTAYGILRIAPCSYSKNVSSQNVLIWGAVNVTDSSGREGTTLQLSPPVRPIGNPDQENSDVDSWTTLSVIGCSLDTSDGHVKVNGKTSLLVKEKKKKDKDHNDDDDDNHKHNRRDSHKDSDDGPHWQNWDPAFWDPDIGDSWAQIMNTPIRSSVPASDCFLFGISPESDQNLRPCAPPDLLNVVELYVNQQLQLNVPGNQTRQYGASLKDLEAALSNATAAVYWAGHQQDLVTGEQQTNVMMTRFQLSINVVPLIIGLFASVLLLGLCVFFVWSPRHNDSTVEPASPTTSAAMRAKKPKLDSLGLLQFFWIFGKYDYQYSVEERIAEVETPSTQNLRRAGMFAVQMDGLRIRGEKFADPWS